MPCSAIDTSDAAMQSDGTAGFVESTPFVGTNAYGPRGGIASKHEERPGIARHGGDELEILLSEGRVRLELVVMFGLALVQAIVCCPAHDQYLTIHNLATLDISQQLWQISTTDHAPGEVDAEGQLLSQDTHEAFTAGTLPTFGTNMISESESSYAAKQLSDTKMVRAGLAGL
jgi:hypothetical protein